VSAIRWSSYVAEPQLARRGESRRTPIGDITEIAARSPAEYSGLPWGDLVE
jgi:hypothetical protein